LRLHNFLFLFGFIILDKKESVHCVAILVEYDPVVQLSVVVLALVNHALHRLQIAQEVEKSLCFDALIAVHV
jgi:hypothetical protein